MQKPEYKKVFAISQSAIKNFRSKSIKEFKKIYVDQEEEDLDDKFAFGSLVDTLVFNPELLNDRFFIPEEEVNIPGEKVKSIIDSMYREAKRLIEDTEKLNKSGNLPEELPIRNIYDIYDWRDLIIKYAKEIKYGGDSWSSERIMKNVIDDGRDYFTYLAQSNGRYVITNRDNGDAIEMNEALKSDKNVSGYFVEQEDETLLFQQEIFVDHKDEEGFIIPLKGAIDIIRLNHKDKTIQIADLKTTYNSQDFEKTAKKFGYVIQASFYRHIIYMFIKEYKGGIYEDYTILPFVNISIDRDTKVPYLYEYTDEDLYIAHYGSKEYNHVGWLSTLSDIIWHIKTGVWDRTKELYLNGRIYLKIFQ